MQGYMRPLENRPGTDSEIEFAGVAAVECPFPAGDTFTRPTRGTCGTVGPQAVLKVFPGGLLIRDKIEKLESADCTSAHCGSQIALECVRWPRPEGGMK
jgi:hypothetical protein